MIWEQNFWSNFSCDKIQANLCEKSYRKLKWAQCSKNANLIKSYSNSIRILIILFFHSLHSFSLVRLVLNLFFCQLYAFFTVFLWVSSGFSLFFIVFTQINFMFVLWSLVLQKLVEWNVWETVIVGFQEHGALGMKRWGLDSWNWHQNIGNLDRVGDWSFDIVEFGAWFNAWSQTVHTQRLQ